MKTTRSTLAEHLAVQYPFNIIADPDGGYVIIYPDLPGCMTQVEDISEIAEAATEIRKLWIETEYEDGHDIPPPSYPEEHSGKFNLRIAKSLHRRLVESAEREGVSLNQYAMSLLDKGDALARVERRLGELELRLTAIDAQLRYRVSDAPAVSRRRATLYTLKAKAA
ncbi:MAG: type II toxin-antitoxin system HicB family antitoxin [Dehalococcoidia bacterium]|nr:type II toxin-antitoxin system HicB family antitoxin [Dehalococcoidia bacterium]